MVEVASLGRVTLRRAFTPSSGLAYMIPTACTREDAGIAVTQLSRPGLSHPPAHARLFVFFRFARRRAQEAAGGAHASYRRDAGASKRARRSSDARTSPDSRSLTLASRSRSRCGTRCGCTIRWSRSVSRSVSRVSEVRTSTRPRSGVSRTAATST